ncbi:MAG: CvpA family protein [Caulobacteraceae bacterium]
MNWVDYVIIVFLLLGLFMGMKKGLIMSLSNVACIIISIIVAKNYYKLVSVFLIQNTPIEEKIAKFLSDKNFAKSLMAVPSGVSTVFSSSSNFTSDLNSFVSILILNAISVLVVFLIVRLILGFVEGFLAGIVEVPGFRELNRLGGGLVGCAKNVIILMLIFTVATPISAMQLFTPLGEGIKSSVIAKYFYNYNFILGWVWSAALDIIKKASS